MATDVRRCICRTAVESWGELPAKLHDRDVKLARRHLIIMVRRIAMLPFWHSGCSIRNS